MSGRCVKCNGVIYNIKHVIINDEAVLEGLCSECVGFFDYNEKDDYAQAEWVRMDDDTVMSVLEDRDVDIDGGS